MKKVFFLLFALCALFVTSCTNEDVPFETAEQDLSLRSQLELKKAPNFKIENGIIKFQSKDDYLATYEFLEGKSQEELLAWSSKMGYASLLSAYEKEDELFLKTFVPEKRDYGLDEEIIDKSERLRNPYLSTLYNEKGLLIVDKWIFKVRGENVYTIENEDFAKVREIENASDSKSLDNIQHYKHTTKLQSVASQSDAVTLRNTYYNGDRTYVIDISSTERQYTNFEVNQQFMYPSPNPLFYIQPYMIGRKQTKVLVWLPATEHEIYSGSVYLHGYSTLYGYNSKRIDGQKVSNLIAPATMVVTFVTKKHPNHIEYTYINTYNI